ncbi:alpha-L-fucosidase [Chondrinema litorale]|uniref:alpha-L-fucosidase n=1 Tax=Chondrinema litorale TaxID=2994555 RepID=UPI0025439B54|nr:alpha-L-fucosidase [Chondrinema litorale]UZR94781.1 alpha-L-fucosidase [Chondrinema litorale]
MIFAISSNLTAQIKIKRNKPEREAWFSSLGFGMFIHWSLDAQVGSVISHSMVGASEDYIDFYIKNLPTTFNPHKFNPDDWAALAKLAGMKYVVFTAKHHSGFCMYDTKTTDFSIMNTPFGKDVTKEIIDAFRKQGIAIGLYFSPDDFYFIHNQGIPVSRKDEKVLISNNKELMDYDKKQLKEMLTQYGKIDILFIDGMDEQSNLLAVHAWDIDPDLVVTRGGMETPEQNLPNSPIPGPWEACFTMGTQWQYKPTNESYKSGTDIINMLIEIRAKGGNLLMNVGPDPYGEIPQEQDDRLREAALWNLVNHEALYGVIPFDIIKENNFWFVKSEETPSTVYAFLTDETLKHGERKEFLIKSLQGNAQTKVSVLGHAGKIVNYQPDKDATPFCVPTDRGLLVSVMRAQRIYNNYQWPNPIVIKIENAAYKDSE